MLNPKSDTVDLLRFYCIMYLSSMQSVLSSSYFPCSVGSYEAPQQLVDRTCTVREFWNCCVEAKRLLLQPTEVSEFGSSSK